MAKNFRYDTTPPIPKAVIGTLVSKQEYDKIVEQRSKNTTQEEERYKTNIYRLREKQNEAYSATLRATQEQDDIEVQVEQARIDRDKLLYDIADLKDTKDDLNVKLDNITKSIGDAEQIAKTWNEYKAKLGPLPSFNVTSLALMPPSIATTKLTAISKELDIRIGDLMTIKRQIDILTKSIVSLNLLVLPIDIIDYIVTFLDVITASRLAKTCTIMRSRWNKYQNNHNNRLVYEIRTLRCLIRMDIFILCAAPVVNGSILIVHNVLGFTATLRYISGKRTHAIMQLKNTSINIMYAIPNETTHTVLDYYIDGKLSYHAAFTGKKLESLTHVASGISISNCTQEDWPQDCIQLPLIVFEHLETRSKPLKFLYEVIEVV